MCVGWRDTRARANAIGDATPLKHPRPPPFQLPVDYQVELALKRAWISSGLQQQQQPAAPISIPATPEWKEQIRKRISLSRSDELFFFFFFCPAQPPIIIASVYHDDARGWKNFFRLFIAFNWWYQALPLAINQWGVKLRRTYKLLGTVVNIEQRVWPNTGLHYWHWSFLIHKSLLER